MHLQRNGWKFREEGGEVERECLLFEAGDYPDRGVRILPEDLRAIAANTPDPVPVKIEHLPETPFDGALGVITRLRATGGQLWGTLRLSAEAWRFVQQAGARALSVALDVAGRRLIEVSFVRHPRVAGAQVFGGERALFHTEKILEETMDETRGEGAPQEERMRSEQGEPLPERRASVRQFAEGLMQYLRGFLHAGEAERQRLEWEREALTEQQTELQIQAFKQGGLLRAAPRAEEIARTMLRFGQGSSVLFGGQRMSVSALFAAFLEANGPVVPMGETARAEMTPSGGASERLAALAREQARRESISYLAAFHQVCAAHPDLARSAREEGLNA
jgi:hypothetical protein